MKSSVTLLPKHQRLMGGLGENLKLARLRRRLSAELLAQRAGISRATLHKVEKGDPTVAMGSYFMVLNVLGLEQEIEHLAADDEFGRRLQDLGLTTARRAPKRDAGS
jgi:transcriptional regulator with XRE-family HTH domain